MGPAPILVLKKKPTFIWIFRLRYFVGAFCLLSVAGCDGFELPFGTGSTPTQSEIIVTADRIALRGPAGFCVDTESSNHSQSEAFVVFGNCAAIGEDEELPQPSVNAIVTATVQPMTPGARVSDSAATLGDVSNLSLGPGVEVVESFERNGALFVRAQGPSQSNSLSDTYWRGYFDLKNSLISISVIGLAKGGPGKSEGLQTLYDFANKIVSDAEDEATPERLKDTDGRPLGLLRRLFG